MSLKASEASPPNRRRRRLLRRFRKDDQGVTAIEFGLVAMPFFAILFSILETSLVFWTTQVLETEVSDAARKIYTGQFQQDNPNKSTDDLAKAFKAEICGTGTKDGKPVNKLPLFDCHGLLKVDVAPATAFPNKVPPIPVKDGVLDTEGFGYRASRGEEIVIVRAVIEYPIFASLMNTNQTNLKNGKRLIMASAVHKNEPFQSTPSGTN